MLRSKIIILMVISSLLLTLPFIGRVQAQSDFDTKLVMLSPNSNSTYKGIMQVNFTIDWIINAPLPWLYMELSYSLDSNPTRLSIDSPNIHSQKFPDNVTTETKTIVNISNLKDGNHTLVIHAEGHYDLDNLFVRAYNHSFEPVLFMVDNSPPTPQPVTPDQTMSPTPTVPELSWLTISPLLLAVAVAIVFRHRRQVKKS